MTVDAAPLTPEAPAHHHVHRHVDDLPFSRAHLKIWGLSAAGMLMGGYSIYLMGVVLPLLKRDSDFSMSDWQVGAIAAAGVFGLFLGAVIFGSVVDKFGRRLMYRLDPLILIVFGTATALSPDPWWMMVSQVFFGMGIGADYPIGSAYVSETMPKRMRARMIGGVIACQAVGGVLAVIAGFVLLDLFEDVSVWRWMIGSVVPIALIVFVFRLGIQESPRWLAEQGRIDEACTALRNLLGPDVELVIPPQAARHRPKPHSWSELFSPAMRRRTILTTVPWLCMDIAVYGMGIFTPIILVQMHFGPSAGDAGSTFIAQRLGAIEGSAFVDAFLIVGFAIGIALMSRVARIRMQILGFACMTAGLGLLAAGASFHDSMPLVIAGFVLFNTMMNAGPNLTTYTIPAEVFPVRLRASGHGLATGFGKIGATSGVLLFPVIQQHIGLIGTLALVAGIALLGALMTAAFRVDPEAEAVDTD